MVGVAERLRSAIADLRNVVLSLRDPEFGFRELELILERRCRELCGDTGLRLNVDGRVEDQELSVFHVQVLPICFELVSNAARHAKARHIELALRIGARLRILISDNGCGLSLSIWQGSRGGLRGIRQRVHELGGGVTLEATATGTHFVVDLPRPLHPGPAKPDQANPAFGMNAGP